ncbi:MAG: metallophosphoesterase family protein [Solirubrobacteraceae bacterium]
MTSLAVISDTHMPRGNRTLPAACVQRLAAVELILHAGDISSATALAELELVGPPVLGVHGNVDDAEVQCTLPAERVVDVGGARIAMVHDGGPSRGRLARMRARFPDADAVIFGHSHLPLHERVPDGLQIFNPGSPTERRRAPTHTMGLALVEAGRVELELIELD